MKSDASSPSEPAEDPRTKWLVRCQPWLKMLADWEIDSRFQGKFSASDAVQQTLLEAWRNWDQCHATDPQQRLAWVRQILAHQLAHLARHYAGTQKRDVAREVSLDQSLARSSLRLDRLLDAGAASPGERLLAEERRLQLAEVLQQLPEDYRQVLILRHMEDLPHEEIAKRMNRSAGAVRMLWVRALAQLRVEMSESPLD
jgi:RNA polymerase sigma-70 factor (ECF subfamily)